MTPDQQKFIDLTPTPQALIRVAIKDLEQAEKNPDYLVHMNQWHDPYRSAEIGKYGKCAVCLAGACMTRFTPPNVDCVPSHYPSPIEKRLLALNSFRIGQVASGLNYLNISMDTLDWYVEIVPEYEKFPKKFKKKMLRLAKDLERKNFKIRA